MDDDLESRRPAAAMWGRSILLALGVAAAAFLMSLCILVGFLPGVQAARQLDAPSAAAATGLQTPAGPTAPAALPPRIPKRAAPAATSDSEPSGLKPPTADIPPGAPSSAGKPPQNKPLIADAAQEPVDTSAVLALSSQADAKPDDVKLDLDAALDELKQSRESLVTAGQAQRRMFIAGALFVGVFALVAIFIVIQVLQLRNWKKRSQESVERVEAMAAQLRPLQDAQEEVRQALPRWLQEVGEQPLSFQEEGLQFPPKALNVLDDIDHLAYVGNARLSFATAVVAARGRGLSEWLVAFGGCLSGALRSMGGVRAVRPLLRVGEAAS